MKTATLPALPTALETDFVGRVQEYVTGKQMAKVGKALGKEGVDSFLDEELTRRQFRALGENVDVAKAFGPNAKKKPWTAYMGVMDGIVSAKAKLAGPPKHTEVTISFLDRHASEKFNDLIDLLFAGIHGPTMPHVRRTGPNELVIRNFTYADACTLGRVGTALFMKEFAGLGLNLRLVLQKNVEQIMASGVWRFLPAALKERMARQHIIFGNRALGTLLTSGGLGWVGGAAREVLEGTGELDVQRRRGNRPWIEDGLDFYARSTSEEVGLPVSGTTLGRQLGGQLRERIEGYKPRGVVKSLEDLANIAMGLGILEVSATGIRALGTMAAALFVATKNTMSEKRMKRRLSPNSF